MRGKDSRFPSRNTPFMSGEEFCALTFGLSVEEISALLGYSPSTVRRWQTEKWDIPFVVQQFLRQRIDRLVGVEWDGWRFGSDGLLYHPFWRRGFSGRELAGMWWGIQQKTTLEIKVKELERKIRRLESDLDQAESRAFFYRSQVRLESSMGMALMRIAG